MKPRRNRASLPAFHTDEVPEVSVSACWLDHDASSGRSVRLSRKRSTRHGGGWPRTRQNRKGFRVTRRRRQIVGLSGPDAVQIEGMLLHHCVRRTPHCRRAPFKWLHLPFSWPLTHTHIHTSIHVGPGRPCCSYWSSSLHAVSAYFSRSPPPARPPHPPPAPRRASGMLSECIMYLIIVHYPCYCRV